MKAYHTTAKGQELKPGDMHDFDDEEAERQIKIGGARLPTAEEAASAAAQDAASELLAKTVDELKTLAEERKVDIAGLTRKADIIAALELAAEKPAA
jgi:DNA-binding ferritin-like protein